MTSANLLLEIKEGEHIAIVGPNASGKTMMVEQYNRQHPSRDIKSIAFRDSYGPGDSSYYLQQRWNQTEIDEETPTVGEELERSYHAIGEDTQQRRDFKQYLFELLDIYCLLEKQTILLSSGEMRKFQLVKALLGQPRILFLDNPFIGLDAKMRKQLSQLLTTISETNSQLSIVNCQLEGLPSFIKKIVRVGEPKTFNRSVLQEIENLPYKEYEYHADEIIRMNKVCIRYGSHTILKDLDWKVMNGERWAIEGDNGSGKSTLLSLVCADNPQSYACDISLFGFRRGSGESIWDIKKHIGYVSPEMHRAYQKDIPVIRIVASGLYDSVGLYKTPKPEDYDICYFWMHIFGIDHLANRTFMKISSGEQRLALLARAFVKDPELLILDEPLHGLDDTNRQFAKEVIETFGHRRNKTILMVTHFKEELPPCITHHLRLKNNT